MTPKAAPDKDLESDGENPAAEKTEPKKPSPFDHVLLFKLKVHNFITSREFTLVPSVMALIGVVILLSLGTWQLYRLSWKNQLIEQIAQNMQAPARDLRAAPPAENAWRELDHRKVMLQGVWQWVRSFKMMPRTYEGAVGYHLYVPLKLNDGQTLVVNRGFVPDGQAILPDAEENVVAVQGVLKLPESRKPWGSPENDPSRGVWVWPDLAAMRHEIGVNSLAPVIFYEARETARDSYPIGGVLPLPSHNRHRQYALVWFALATALMGVWMTYSGPKPDKIRKPDETAAANDDDRLNDPVARRSEYPEATD